MSGLTSTLNIAKSAIAAQQYGLNVTGHNVSNVNNPDFSRQRADHISNTPAMYGGHLFGTGVDVSQVKQTVDTLLENRLTDERSTQSALAEAESYMAVLEGKFSENSEASLNKMLGQFWNSWHDLSTSPLGASQRVQVFEQGSKLAERFRGLSNDLDQLTTDLTKEVEATMTEVNSIASQLADLNKQILAMEGMGTANDLRDQQMGLLDKLGELINVDVITQGDGSIMVNVGNGTNLVNGIHHNTLYSEGGQVKWKGSFSMDITDDIAGGKLGGWLVVRDEAIPKYKNQINALAQEITWNVNKVHSQGVGQEYYRGSLQGTYPSDDSGWLSSLTFGNRIDHTKDFTMWTEDRSKASTEYRKIMVDMGISDAELKDFSGTAPGATQSRYKLTVLDGAEIGDKQVTQANGERLGEVWSTTAGTAVSALNTMIGEQTLTVYGSSAGTHKINIADSGGNAKRSVADIAKELNTIPGVSAHASKTEVEFDLSGVSEAQNGDTVTYELYVDGTVHKREFVVDSTKGSFQDQFEDSLDDAVQALNTSNEDSDLHAEGLKLSSDKGATLGVQNFQITDNAGVRLSNFNNFNSSDKVTFKVASDGVPTVTAEITVDLTHVVNINDQQEMSKVFYDALKDQLNDKPFTVDRDTSDNSIVIRTTNGANLTFRDAGDDTTADATISLANLSGTSTSGAGNTSLEFTGAGDVETFNSNTNHGDYIGFSLPSTTTTTVNGTTSVVYENSTTAAGAATASVMSGSLTVLMAPGMSMETDRFDSGGLFGSSGKATLGGSIMTLGGEEGFSNFAAGDAISFDVDGQAVSFTVPTSAGSTTEAGLAKLLFDELNSDITNPDYSIVRNGKSVSIIKKDDTDNPIKITNFTDGTTGDAKLKVSTGTGEKTHDPENEMLESNNSYRNFSTSSLYDDDGQILWQRLDKDGNETGSQGLVTVNSEGRVTITEGGSDTLSFDLTAGTLTAGNTMTVNTDKTGQPDPLKMKVYRQAHGVNETYQFRVLSSGRVGYTNGEDAEPLVVEWKNSVSSGRFEIPANTPARDPNIPVDVEVDGMLLHFESGMMFKDDMFTIDTDETGVPKKKDADGYGQATTMSDWHWTLDSFSDQFNRMSAGVKASVDDENHFSFTATDYYSVENVGTSGSEGFSTDNVTIEVTDWSAVNFKGRDVQFVRSGGKWGIVNDPTGGQARFLPEGGDDNGFMVDFNGDGVGDMEVKFKKPVTGDGWTRFDLLKHQAADMGFAFGDDQAETSGLTAALGINTFFTGDGARNMGVNEKVQDTKFLAAGKINGADGSVKQGDNRNALAMTQAQDETHTMKQWEFRRGETTTSSLIETSIDDYYSTLMGSLGVKSRNIKNSKAYADVMVNKMTEQRNAVSAVSLDEEMVNLMKYQHAYSAASKLLKTTDEMLNTLISVR